MTICREFYANKMSNDRFRELLGANPESFWSSSLRLCGYGEEDGACRDLWQRHNTQRDGALNHQDLAEAIRQAEDEIARQLGHPIGAEWICQRFPSSNPQGDLSKAYKLKTPYATAFGSRNTQMIAEVHLTDTYETTKIQPYNAVFHSQYEMQWQTPEHWLWAISINGTEYDLSPSGLNINPRRADLQRWLNSLGLGYWYVSMQAPIVPITGINEVPTIEIPAGVTVEFINTYTHAEVNRYRISWDFDGHVIDGTWYDTPGLGLADTVAIDTWADGLGLGNWGVFGCLGGDLVNDPPILLIPNDPAPVEVYGTIDVTSALVTYNDKMVYNGVYYDNTAISGNDAAIDAFLEGLGLDLTYQPLTGVKLIDNPGLMTIHKVVEATLYPEKLFGLIQDIDVSAPAARPFSYILYDVNSDGYYENATILGNSLEPELECEIQIYAVGNKRNGQPDALCRVRPFEQITLDTVSGEFAISIPTRLLIKNELLDQSIKKYDDPFPIDLCCASDDLACDPQSFYLDHLEIWRVWHDDTSPAAIFRTNCRCNSNEPCRSSDKSACVNVATTTSRWVYPKPSEYHTINIPNKTNYTEHDGWQGAATCTPTTVCAVDLHYYFDPCDENCHEIKCTGDICHKFERAVFMLAAARLWDLCPCGCENSRLRTFQRERGGQFQAHSYDGTMQVVSTGGSKAGELKEYPFGMRYGEVEAWRMIKQYIRLEGRREVGGFLL